MLSAHADTNSRFNLFGKIQKHLLFYVTFFNFQPTFSAVTLPRIRDKDSFQLIVKCISLLKWSPLYFITRYYYERKCITLNVDPNVQSRALKKKKVLSFLIPIGIYLVINIKNVNFGFVLFKKKPNKITKPRKDKKKFIFFFIKL